MYENKDDGLVSFDSIDFTLIDHLTFNYRGKIKVSENSNHRKPYELRCMIFVNNQ